MSEPEALRARRQALIEKLAEAADEIAAIDSRLKSISGDDSFGQN